MVLLSAPPTPIPQIQADRVLLITGAYDIGRIRQFAPIMNDLGSPHIESWRLRWAAHSSAIFNPVHIRRIVEWLGGDATKVRTTERILAIFAMLASIVVLGLSTFTGKPIQTQAMPLPQHVVRYIAASGASILILQIVCSAWHG